MKKYVFKVYDYNIGNIFAIREKKQIVQVLIDCTKYFSSDSIENLLSRQDGNTTITLYIDKMSRLFIDKNLSICTFQFPFIVKEIDGFLNFYHNGYLINSRTTSAIFSILSVCNLNEFNSIFEGFYDAMSDYDINEYESNYEVWALLADLLLFEPGYLRYDFDIERANGQIHPLYHFDLCYSQNTTFKLGLPAQINTDEFIDVLDINTICKYLHEYS